MHWPNVAWDSRDLESTSFETVGPRAMVEFSEHFHKRLCSLISIYDSYSNIKQLYNSYYRLHYVINIVTYSIAILSAIYDRSHLFFTLVSLIFVLYDFLIIFTSAFVTSEFQVICYVRYTALFTNEHSFKNHELQNANYKFGLLHLRFDCGYFVLDFPILSLIVDLVSLLVFAMLDY